MARPKNVTTKNRHVLAFSDEDYASIMEAAGGERKVADYLVGLHRSKEEIVKKAVETAISEWLKKEKP